RAFRKQTAKRRQNQRRRQPHRGPNQSDGEKVFHLSYTFERLSKPNRLKGPRNNASAATKRITTPWRTSTRSLVTLLVKASTKIPPRMSMPNKIADNRTPTGWLRPNSATEIPVNP